MTTVVKPHLPGASHSVLSQATAPPSDRLITPATVIGWAAGSLVVAAVVFAGSAYQVYVAGFILIYAMAAVGLEWLMGRAGQVSIGNAALLAIGAYTTAILAPHSWAPFPIPMIAAGVVGAAVGLLIGLPALRLRGIYLALATLALHFITLFVVERYQEHTKAISGLRVAAPTLGPFDFTHRRSFVALLAILLAALVLLLANLYRHSPGRLWLSIRESELGASALGVDVTRWKMSAFVGSSVVVAVAGSLLAYYTRTVSAETFSLDLAISFLVMVIVGGVGSIGGAIVGATLVTAAPYALKALSDQTHGSGGLGRWLDKNVFLVNNGLYGVILLVFLLYRPEGIAPLLRSLGRRLTSRPAPRHDAGDERPPAVAASGRASEEPELATRAAQRPTAVLEVRDLHVAYHTGARAVDGIDVRVEPGTIVALLGRNGAGKTSTLRAIGGFFRSEGADVGGQILFDGKDIRGWSPTATSRRGLALVPERDKVFPTITTVDHLRLAAPHGRVREEVYEIFPRLRERANIQAGLLSGGERQMLAMAMAWLLQPKLLLVDELSLGLAPVIVRDLVQRLAEISARDDIAVLLVEQNATAALSIAHYAYVLDSGVLVGEGEPDELRSHEALTAAYLGVRR